jgi:hypothetical protein
MHTLQLSQYLRDNPGFLAIVPGPWRLYYNCTSDMQGLFGASLRLCRTRADETQKAIDREDCSRADESRKAIIYQWAAVSSSDSISGLFLAAPRADPDWRKSCLALASFAFGALFPFWFSLHACTWFGDR